MDNILITASGRWLAFAGRLGEAVFRFALWLVYFLVLTPLALFRRLFDRDPLGLAARPGAASYFRAADRAYSPADLERPW